MLGGPGQGRGDSSHSAGPRSQTGHRGRGLCVDREASGGGVAIGGSWWSDGKYEAGVTSQRQARFGGREEEYREASGSGRGVREEAIRGGLADRMGWGQKRVMGSGSRRAQPSTEGTECKGRRERKGSGVEGERG